MGSSSKTIRDFDIVPLMKGTGDLYKNLSLEAYKNIPNGMGAVMANYGQGIVKISSMYNDGFLTAMGYNPRENILYNEIDESKLREFVRDNIDPDITSFSSYRLGSVTMEDMSLKYLQDNYTGFYVNNKVFTDVDGKMYVYWDAVSNGSMVDIITYLNAGDTIDDYVTVLGGGWEVVSYPISPTEVDGQLYWVVTLTRTYMTTPEPPEEPVEVTDTQVVNIELIYNYKQTTDINDSDANFIANKYNGYYASGYWEQDVYYSNESEPRVENLFGASTASVVHMGDVVFNVTYSSSGGSAFEAEVQCSTYVSNGMQKDIQELLEKVIIIWNSNGDSKIYYGNKNSFGDIYSINEASAYPIIPLKVNGSLVNSTTNQYVTLGKIGLSGDDFTSSLRDKKLNSAFLFFAVRIDDTSIDNAVFKYESLFGLISSKYVDEKFFKYGDRREVIRVWYGGLDVEFQCVLDTKLIVGTIGPVGTYNGSTLVVRKQVDPLYYFELTIRAAATNYNVVGRKFTAGIGIDLLGKFFGRDRYTIMESGPIIPLTTYAMRKMPYRVRCNVLEKSMHLMVYMKDKVKVKWYQTGIFQFVMMIVAVVITVLSWGSLSGVGGALMGTAMSVGQALAVAGLVMGFASMMGVNTGVLGQVLGILSIIYGGMAGLTKGGLVGGMMTANSLVQAVSMANSIMIQRDMKALMSEVEKSTANNEQAQADLMEQIEQLQNPLLMPYQDRLAEIDSYYAVATGELQYGYDMLYNYDIIYQNNQVQGA